MNDSSINIEVKGLLNDLTEKIELKSKLDEKKKIYVNYAGFN